MQSTIIYFFIQKPKDYIFNWQSVLTDYSESSKERVGMGAIQ